jgi:hypothetical protein
MVVRNGFTKLSIREWEDWMGALKINRTCLYIQQHHTCHPDYSLFNGANHFYLQQEMKEHDVFQNGWAAIGQHFTVFPDGSILTGRSMEKSPACITGNNAHAVCIKALGNFEPGSDTMTSEQQGTLVRITALLCKKFNLPVTTGSIVYHHWFDLETGERNDGSGNNCPCPGTGFFGGNTVADCRRYFLPQVQQRWDELPVTVMQKRPVTYARVTTDRLNIRKQPVVNSDKVTGAEPVGMGTIVGVYNHWSEWLKISPDTDSWIPSTFAREVKKITLLTDIPLVRSGPGDDFSPHKPYRKGQEFFIEEAGNGWCRVLADNKWIRNDFLKW